LSCYSITDILLHAALGLQSCPQIHTHAELYTQYVLLHIRPHCK
jgi:hypothetical protein